MHDRDYYSKLGFKCGLEIHQRLATKHKLFCRCSATIKEDPPIQTIERRQRAVAGELGKIDEATRFESMKERKFVYQLFKDSTCLVDTDEEPPATPSSEALEIVLLASRSMGCEIPDEVEVMRKGVVDGSDPSAFQRTMLCGYGGEMEVNGKKISIPSIFLEEESSGIVAGSQTKVIYEVDRLGIPLIEVDTDPVIETPQDAKAVAMRIGLLLRLTGRAQRGIGSIRQDVNVSIKEGARVEIKGLQEIESVDELIENEVQRQINLVAIAKELKARKANIHHAVDVSKVFKGSEAKVIGEQVWKGGAVIGIRLENFKGLIGKEIAPKTRLGSEISSYAKMAEVKGIIHGDEEMHSYNISEKELESLSHELELKESDSFILIAESKEKAEAAMVLAVRRAKLAFEGVPSETRAADSKNKTTRFLRPIPGGSRMYPETDALPIETKEYVEKISSKIIDIDSMKKSLEHEIKNKQLAEQMLWSKDLSLYEEITHKTNANPKVIASVILEKFRELGRSGVDLERIGTDALEYLFRSYAKGVITRSALEELLKGTPKERWEVERAMREKGLNRLSKKEIRGLVEKEKEKGKNKKEMVREIMSKHRLVVDGEDLNEVLNA